jgi:type II secretory pathway pseudopilin PulG
MALFAVAALGLLAATAGQVWHTAAQRAREADLLFAGQQYRQALASYYSLSIGGKHQYPSSLQELLEDRRSQVTLRHLRRIYMDPMTGQADWVLVTAEDRIVGLHSRSLQHPFKRKFEEADAAFNDADSYAQWVFRAAVSEQATGARRSKSAS